MAVPAWGLLTADWSPRIPIVGSIPPPPPGLSPAPAGATPPGVRFIIGISGCPATAPIVNNGEAMKVDDGLMAAIVPMGLWPSRRFAITSALVGDDPWANGVGVLVYRHEVLRTLLRFLEGRLGLEGLA